MSVISLLRSGKGPMDGWVARAYDRGVQAAFREQYGMFLDEMGPMFPAGQIASPSSRRSLKCSFPIIPSALA